MKRNLSNEKRKDLVLIGGGHAHVHVLKMCGMNPLREVLASEGIQVTLISDTILTPYSGMLPGYIANHYTWEDIHLDLSRLCRFANIRFIHSAAVRIEQTDQTNGFVHCSDRRPPVRYNVLSLDIGITPTSIPISGNACFTNTPSVLTAVKPISGFAERYAQIRERLKQGAHKFTTTNPFILAVVGGGAGGIEIALSSHYNMVGILKEANGDAKAVKVLLITRGDTLLESHNKKARSIFNRVLAERGIDVVLQAEVVGIERVETSLNQELPVNDALTAANCSLHLQQIYCFVLSSKSKPQPPIIFHECLWCTTAGAPSWIAQQTPLQTSPEGFIQVHSTYQSTSHTNIFAAGDCCNMVSNPRPKAGVFAVRAGPPLRNNLIAYLLQRPLKKHKPQLTFLGLISTGDKYAVASRGRWALEGRYLWKLKDKIDRKFMRMYQQLPKMTSPHDIFISETNIERHEGSPLLSAAAMRCGGCGAKVGATVVARVLNDVRKRSAMCRESISDLPTCLFASGQQIDYDDAAVIILPARGGGAQVQTIDFFRSFIDDPFVFGKVAAVHAMSDCFAMGVDAQTALALAVVPYSSEESITEATLTAMLSGACDALEKDGCQLVGGHTSEGAEMALGLSVTGLLDNPEIILSKKGGRVGDKIVLTKPIGTGALFAADMRAECQGAHVAQALTSMIKSNRPASKIARKFPKHIRACTDVTGFGLCGHLLEMLVANDSDSSLPSIGAVLNLNSIPFLKGAVEASSKGIVSSLFRDNFRSRRAITNHAEVAAASKTLYPLIFDPQTAGGLLFFVSPNVCEEFLSLLKGEEGGFNTVAAIIGEVVDYNDAKIDNSNEYIIGGKGKSISHRLTISF